MMKIEVKVQGRAIDHYNLEKTPVVIGRDPSCDVPVDNPLLSRRHAQITAENGKFFVEDLHSTNGVFLRGTKISKEEIHDGDEIRIDKFSFHVKLPEAEAEKKPKEFAFDIMGTMQVDSRALQEKLKAEAAAPKAAAPAASHAPAHPAAPAGKSNALWMGLGIGLAVGFLAGFLVAKAL